MVRIRVRIRFSVWLVSCYAHVFVHSMQFSEKLRELHPLM